MMCEHDRLEAQAAAIKARQKALEYAVPTRVLTQIRNLALAHDGHSWDLAIALADEGLAALAAATGTAETSEDLAQGEASQSGPKGNAQPLSGDQP